MLIVYLQMELLDGISVLDIEIMHLPLSYNIRVCVMILRNGTALLWNIFFREDPIPVLMKMIQIAIVQ